jgi:hypothetical protein
VNRAARRSRGSGGEDVGSGEPRIAPDLGQFKDRPEGDAGDYLTVSDPSLTYFPGTTIPAIGLRFRERADGLLVPEDASRSPQPIDLIKTYVTFSEAFGFPPPDGYVADGLRGINRDQLIRACAYLLGAYEKFGASRSDIDRRLAESWLKGAAKGRVLDLIRKGSTLCAPQSLLLLIEFALLRPSDEPDAGTTTPQLPALILAIQENLGGDDVSDDDPVFTGDTHSRLFRLIVASHHFGQSEDPATTIAHHHQRWVRLAREYSTEPGAVDLYAAFREATGVEKDDFTTVGLAIWAHCETHDAYPISSAALDSFKIPRQSVDRALSLMSATATQFRQMLVDVPEEYQTEWSFDLLRRFPLLRLDNGDVLVLSKTLLLERIYGWLPIFDLTQGLKDAKRRKDADRAEGWFRHLCELDARESLAAIAGPSRYYGEEAIQAAFGTTTPNSDAAIEYPNGWVVIEISTRQLQRATVVASDPAALEADLNAAIDEKVSQVDQTIKDLIADESRLTEAPAIPRRRYIAVVVLAEGFPVNPMTMTAIKERLAAAGRLADARIGQLHVLDQEELDMAEAIVEEGGASLFQLLEEHEQSSLSISAFKDWLILDRGRGTGPRRPRRLEGVRAEAWQPAIERLQSAGAERDEPTD